MNLIFFHLQFFYNLNFLKQFLPKIPHSPIGQVKDGIHLLDQGCALTRSAWVPQATNFQLWATGKTYFFHISLSAGHPGFHG